MKRADIVTSTRHAGNVRRYHTHPTLRQQTVADHSWHVMRIFLELFPDAVTVEVLTYILYHDIAEIGTGDLPFPVKAAHPGLAEVMHDVEAEVLDNMGVVLPDLTSRERVLVKVCDLCEMFEWGREEVTMGNRYAQPIVDDTRAAVLDMTVREPGSLHHDIIMWMDGGREG
jgi:5'-deoxynucleotidase YfbR-like HD superfamily hydrolase